jgi:hypothetical protein
MPDSSQAQSLWLQRLASSVKNQRDSRIRRSSVARISGIDAALHEAVSLKPGWSALRTKQLLSTDI